MHHEQSSYGDGQSPRERHVPRVREPRLTMRSSRALIAGVAALAVAIPLVVRSGHPDTTDGTKAALPVAETVSGQFADFGSHVPSADARYVADWIADSRDNMATDFIMVDKKTATVYVFDKQARLRGASPVLLGAAVGDDTVPGIGDKPLNQVLPEERTTPAGRFLAERGRNAEGVDVVWLDYDAAVSMHRVKTTNPIERRLERLASTTVDDNRISWGCVNVPVAFYESTIRPMFATQRAVVYVLPDTKSVQQVFGAYDVASRNRVAAHVKP